MPLFKPGVTHSAVGRLLNWRLCQESSHPTGVCLVWDLGAGRLAIQQVPLSYTPDGPLAALLSAMGVPQPRSARELSLLNPNDFLGREALLQMERGIGETLETVITAAPVPARVSEQERPRRRTGLLAALVGALLLLL